LSIYHNDFSLLQLVFRLAQIVQLGSDIDSFFVYKKSTILFYFKNAENKGTKF